MKKLITNSGIFSIVFLFTVNLHAQLADKVVEIDPQDGVFVITYDVVPSQNPIDAAIGLGENPATTWGDLIAYFRFKPVGGSMGGYIDARNCLDDGRGKWIVEGDTLFYQADKKYSVKMEVNMIDTIYTVSVMPEDSSAYTVIGTDLGFRRAVETLNYLSVIINNTDFPEWIGTVELSDIKLNWEHHPLESVQKEAFTVEFDAVPEALNVNCVIGLTDTTARIEGWLGYRDLGPIIRFNANPSVIDVRNGSQGYMSDVSIPYEAGKSYHFRMVADPVGKTYDVFCRPEGGNTVQIADNYAFRRQASDSLVYWVRQHDWGESQGVLKISNFAVITPELEYQVKGSVALKNPQTGSFITTMNITPSHSPMDGVVGLSENPIPANGWSWMAAMVRFNRDGFLDVRNGDGGGYGALVEFAYEAGVKYAVKFDVNMVTRKYSVTVTPEGGTETTLATDYDFRVKHPADTLGYVNTIVVYETAETIGSWANVSDIQLDWENWPLRHIQTGSFVFEVDAVPDRTTLDHIVSLSKVPKRWYDSPCRVRFRPDGTMDVRGSSGWGADTTLAYEAGKSYHIKMDVNIVEDTYSVFITPEGGEEITLATDFDLRFPVDTLAWWGRRHNWDDIPEQQVDVSNALLDWENWPLDEIQTSAFAVEFDAVPDDIANAVIGLTEFPTRRYGSFSPIVRFKTEGVLDARNGSSGYMADEVLAYEVGKSYHIRMEVDIAFKTYNVIVTPEGADPVALATGYGFRAEADTLSWFSVRYDRSEALGELTFSNFQLGEWTAVNENDVAVITDYELKQNYPNPFNPSTTIDFALPKSGEVKIDVFDVLGHKAAELVNARMLGGRHSVTFDASKFASGVYFYKLQANDKVLIKKMMLLK